MAETSEDQIGNGTSAVMDSVPVPSPNPEGETEQPITRTVVTTDKIQLKARRGRPPGTSKFNVRPSDPGVALINSINGDSRFEVSARRRAPDSKEIGSAIPQGPVSAIKEYLEQTHGSGVYCLTVTDNGVVIPREEGGYVEIQIKPKQIDAEESEDLKTVKLQTQKINEQKKQAEAQRELKRAQREIEEEEAAAKRAAEEEKNGPILSLIEKLNEKIERLAQPKQSEWTIDKIAVLITAAAPIIAMLKPEKDNSIKEVLQTINESNRQQTEKLMKLLEQKSEKNKDELSVLEIYMKVKKELREENKEFQDRLAALSSSRGGDDDDLDIDPNNIWGSLAAAGVKGIIHLFKHGGPGMVEAIQKIAANVGKTPEQLTTADEPNVQAAIAEAAAAQRARQPVAPLPVPQVQQRIPLGPPRILKLPPMKPVDPGAPTPILKSALTTAAPTTDGATVQPGATPTPSGVAPVAVENSAPIVGASATGVPVESSSLPVAPVFKLASEQLENDLSLEINKSIDDIIMDVQSGRVVRGAALVWVDEALDRWNIDFLKYLETIPSHMERRKIIMARAAQEQREALDKALLAEEEKLEAEKPGEKRYLWNNYFNSFEVLIRAFQERQKERKS